MTREAVIVDTVRTPIGKRKGALVGWHPTDLLGFALQRGGRPQRRRPRHWSTTSSAAASPRSASRAQRHPQRAGSPPGLPWHVPATSVDRQCGSSQQAVHFVAQGVIAGAYDLAIACGVESMTRAPLRRTPAAASGRSAGLPGRRVDSTLGIQFGCSQVLADRFGITREEMDAFALAESTAAPQRDTDTGHFAREILPVPIKDADGEPTGECSTADEGIRRGSTLESLGRARRRRGTRPPPRTSPRATRRR